MHWGAFVIIIVTAASLLSIDLAWFGLTKAVGGIDDQGRMVSSALNSDSINHIQYVGPYCQRAAHAFIRGALWPCK